MDLETMQAAVPSVVGLAEAHGERVRLLPSAPGRRSRERRSLGGGEGAVRREVGQGVDREQVDPGRGVGDAVGGAAPMVGALRKLAQKNLSNLTPHPWYSAFHYSHPTIVERERALAK